MRTSELMRLLSKGGCKLLEHGKRHDKWINPKTGATTLVDRHPGKEMAKGTAMGILKRMGLK